MAAFFPRIRWLGPIALVAACGGDDGPPRDAPPVACIARAGTTVTTVEIASVDDYPLLLTSPPDDPRLFVLERSGAIRIIADGHLVPAPFIDLDDNAGGPVDGDGEMGLLGLAFHPDYATNGRFYVYYTTSDIFDQVAEYRVSATDPNLADPATARVLLSIPDFASNHNGGMIEFGSDGYLYISDGDGGNAGDPERTAQDLDRLLGKIMRIDVDTPSGGREYGIPADNPYAAGGGAPEVYMYGLRNPWRWSFDRANGDIYIGDVGQASVEEIDVISASDAPGADFGWSDCEGTHDYYGTGCATPTQANRHLPVHEEIRPDGGGTSNWTAVIGGQVYRGACFPGLNGRYFFSDDEAGGIWSMVYTGGQVTDFVRHDVEVPQHAAFIHADAYGELYVGFGNGSIHRIEVQ